MRPARTPHNLEKPQTINQRTGLLVRGSATPHVVSFRSATSMTLK
jgi:hypothetical protein